MPACLPHALEWNTQYGRRAERLGESVRLYVEARDLNITWTREFCFSGRLSIGGGMFFFWVEYAFYIYIFVIYIMCKVYKTKKEGNKLGEGQTDTPRTFSAERFKHITLVAI